MKKWRKRNLNSLNNDSMPVVNNEPSVPKNNVLLVLGNGFDIACGFKTKYEQFFNYLKGKDSHKELFGYCDRLPDNDRLLNSKVADDLLEKITNYMQKHQDINFWDLYLYMQLIVNKNMHGKNWLDVEESIKSFVAFSNLTDSINFSCKNRFGANVYSHDEHPISDVWYYVIFDRLSMKYSQLPFGRLSYGTIRDYLYSELGRFEKEIAAYISIYDNDECIAKRSELLEKIKNKFPNSNFKICTFNYTRIDFPDKDIMYVHGNLTNPIIGFDHASKNNLDYGNFIKENRRTSSDSYITYRDFLDGQKYTFAFYGLSFSSTDFDEFGKLFEYLSEDYRIYLLYNSKIPGKTSEQSLDGTIKSFVNMAQNFSKLKIKNHSDYNKRHENNNVKEIAIS